MALRQTHEPAVEAEAAAAPPRTQKIDGIEIAHQLCRVGLRFGTQMYNANRHGNNAINSQRRADGLRELRLRYFDQSEYQRFGNPAGFRYRRITDHLVELYHDDHSVPTAGEIARLAQVGVVARIAPEGRSLWVTLQDNPHLAIQDLSALVYPAAHAK